MAYRVSDIIRMDVGKRQFHFLVLATNKKRLYTLLSLEDGVTNDYFKRDIDGRAIKVA